MGERKGTNKYYPPDFDPKKHSSLDAYHGTHPLRERAKKIKEGILVIRFEMPYNIWCDGCQNPIGMGVRYNAEKSKLGKYYTTTIYQFRMKCHLCDMYFVIKTDPANHDYVITEGARRKEQRWDPKDNEQIVTEDKNDVKKRALDAMYKLEHGVTDKTSQKKTLPGLAELIDKRARWKDDYQLTKDVGDTFWKEKKILAKEKDFLKRSSLDIPLVKEDEGDIRLAGLLNKHKVQKTFDERQMEEREAFASHPIMAATDASSSPVNPLMKTMRTAIVRKRNSLFTSPKPRTVTAASLGIVHKGNVSKSNPRGNGVAAESNEGNSERVRGVSVDTVGQAHNEETRTDDSTCNVASKSSLDEKEKTSANISGLGLLFGNYHSSSCSESDD